MSGEKKAENERDVSICICMYAYIYIHIYTYTRYTARGTAKHSKQLREVISKL